MNDLAIAISVYDRWQDVRILVDLIRANWPGRYYIAVCSSHPDPAPHLADCAIDQLLTVGAYSMEGPPILNPRVAPRARLWVRVIESVRKLGDHCARSSGAPYTVHLHADAVPLSWPKLRGIAETLARDGKCFAARGEGFAFYTVNEPVGGFDDMFFLFENAFARETALWELDPFDFLPHKISIHGLLAILGLTRVGLQRFYHYASHHEAIHWDGKPNLVHPFNSAQPMYFDPRYAFLHIHEDAFPDHLAHYLKAYYLRRFGITKGKTLARFLATWAMPETALFAALAAMERRCHRFFRCRGLTPTPYGRNFDRMAAMRERYIHLPWYGKVQWLFERHVNQVKDLLSKAIRRRVMRGRIYRDRYLDTVWPDDLDALYAATYVKTPPALRAFSLEG